LFFFSEYDGYDDVYGHSVEDECISPTDANQWIYDRAKGQQSRTEFLANHRNIEEENEEDLNPQELHRRDSESYELPELDPIERAKLMSCMEEIRNIVGDTVSEKQLVETIMHLNYDLASSLDAVLNINKTPPMAEKKAANKAAIEKGEYIFVLGKIKKTNF
jgi:elongation factor 1 alpha-like protein